MLPSSLHRGRSRQVSSAAIARKASEERRQSRLPRSPPVATFPVQVQCAVVSDADNLFDDMDDSSPPYFQAGPEQGPSEVNQRSKSVSDDDFRFVPDGPLNLDEESIRAMEESDRLARERQRRYQLEMRLQEQEQLWEEQRRRSRLEKLRAERLREERAKSRDMYRLEVKTKARSYGSHEQHRAPAGYISSHRPLFPVINRPLDYSSRPFEAPPVSAVPFIDVLNSMQGSLFSDEPFIESPSKSKTQTRLLHSLLTVVQWEDGERRKVKGKGKDCTLSHSRKTTSASCVACSLASNSTISRSNSWSSASSRSSIDTAITTPPSSPVPGKTALPPLAEDSAFKALVHSCSRKNFSIVPLANSPLSPIMKQPVVVRTNNTSEAPKSSSVSMLGRLRKSISVVMGVASQVQASYIRVILYSVPSPNLPRQSKRSPPPLKPEGQRARRADVKSFITYSPDITPTQVIPLGDPHPLNPPRVFPPLSMPPPSPLRPRYPPSNPEWRVRPIPNPVVLRIKALHNYLGANGIKWEGYAPDGRLGCGRDKLTGVAFEGLGGSRLAYEVGIEA